MGFSEFFIRRPVATTMLMATIIFFGVISYKALPVSDLPDVDYPTIEIDTSYYGASPEIMSNNVTSVLEKQLMTISGIDQIVSSSSLGSSSIVVSFNLDKSLESAATDVQSAINKASGNLPSNLPFPPTYTKVNPASHPILYVALKSSSIPEGKLYDFADSYIGRRINILPGVGNVQIFGSSYAVRVQVDPQKLTSRNLTLDDVGAAIRGQNQNQPLGNLYGSSIQYTLWANSQLYSASEYNQLIIKSKDGSIVKLTDIGRAFDSTQQDKFFLNYSTKEETSPCVIIAVRTQPGANAMQVIDRVHAFVADIKKTLPADAKLEVIFDRGVYIKEAIDDVQFTLIVAFLLVVAVIFFYLGKAINTLIPAAALPIIILGTFSVMYVCGFNLDILSLMAITLSVGFLVDDAIVVVENITRHIELGMPPMDAAIKGAKEITFTVISMTLCLGSVFIPMLFLSGVIGRVFHEFAVTIIAAIIISGIISLTLTPLLASRLMLTHNAQSLTKLEKLSSKINDIFLRFYERSLTVVLNYKKTMVLVGTLCIAISGMLFMKISKGFFPQDDLGVIMAFSQSNDSTSPFLMEQLQRKVTEITNSNPYVKSVGSVGALPTSNQGFMFISLTELGKRPPISEVIEELNKDFQSVVGTDVYFQALPLINLDVGTSNAQGDYQCTLQSLDEDALFKYSKTFTDALRATPGFVGVNSDLHIQQPELKIIIDREKASMRGVDVADIETIFVNAYTDSLLSTINNPTTQNYVILEVEPKYYSRPSMISQLYVRNKGEDLVPIIDLVKLKASICPISINHYQGIPSVTISFSLNDIPLSAALQKIEEIKQASLPDAITVKLQGNADAFKKSFANLTFLLIVTFFVIYAILGILYENFIHPITVMSTLPPAALGALLALVASGNIFSLYSFVGLVMLLGIVLKNGIIMIDFANTAIEEGKSVKDAIYYACTTRFRPILMTTISTLMGALPVALGIGGSTAQSRKSLGIALVGGLIISQILTLYLTPITFIYMEKLRASLKSKSKKA